MRPATPPLLTPEEPIRSADVEVPQLVQLLELKPGMAVADVGAGFWAWTMGFARWLGPAGRVYATDVGATQLAALRDAVHRERLSTITVLAGAIDATNLPEACCDAILIRDYHHLTQPEAMIRSLAASLPFWADQAASDNVYDLRQVGVLYPSPGRELGPRAIGNGSRPLVDDQTREFVRKFGGAARI